MTAHGRCIPLAGYAVTWLTRPAIVLALLASVAAIVSAPIMLGATEGAFSAVADNPANTFEAAANFCATAPRTLNATADTYVAQNTPDTNDGDDGAMQVASGTGQNSRVLVRFALPVAPVQPECPMTSAVLRLNKFVFGSPGRTLHAKRATGGWSELAATWTNQPIATDVDLATAPSGTDVVDFNVTAQVASMYAGTNNGFLVRDSVENGSGTQIYSTREYGQPATLILTYG